MPTSYPGGIDDFPDPSPSDPMTGPSHSGLHGDANDAIHAIETLLGVEGGNVVMAAGDTMSGPLVLSGDPTVALGAAPKQYVDGAVALRVALAPAPSGDTTGETDQAMITAESGSGIKLILQSGVYYFKSLVWDNTNGVSIEGQGGRFSPNTNQFGATEIRCVATGAATGISARGSSGFHLDHLACTYNQPTFTGTLIDLSGNSGSGGSDTHSPTIGRDCSVRGGATGNVNASMLINLDQALNAQVDCIVANAVTGIKGKASNASYSNGVSISVWHVGGITQAVIWNPDCMWDIHDGVYEPLTSGAPGMVGHDAGVLCRGVTIRDNWTGDDTAAGAWATLAGGGIRIFGNTASAQAATSSFLKADGAITGLEIGQNSCYINTTSAYLLNPNGQVLSNVSIAPQAWMSSVSLSSGALPAGSRVTDPNFPQGVRQIVAQQTLAANAATITFSSIPQTGSLLRLTVIGASNTAAEATQYFVRLNGDSGAHYDIENIYGQSTTFGSNSVTGQAEWYADNVDLPGASATAGTPGRLELTIPNYASSAWQKIGKWESGLIDIPAGAANTRTYISEVFWRSEAAVTSITVTAEAGSFVAGTTAILEIE